MKQMPILFSYNDLRTIYPNASSFFSFVSRYLKQGKIMQIKKGLYALVDPSTNEIYATRFQIASRLFDDSFFSYHEALEYYGLSNQSFVSNFTYLCHTYAKGLEFQGVRYESKKSDCHIQILDRMKEEGVRVVSLDRAIVDAIDCPSLSGGIEEIEYALENAPDLNISSIEQMLDHYDKDYLYRKVGFLFEKKYGSKIPEDFYDKCLSHVTEKIFYFESRAGHAKLNSKWRLMVEEKEYPDELF